jgi:hypothetical protein
MARRAQSPMTMKIKNLGFVLLLVAAPAPRAETATVEAIQYSSAVNQ